MQKSTFIGGLVVLTCLLTVLIFLASPPGGRVKTEEDQARKRLQILANQAKGKHIEKVRLLSLQSTIERPLASANMIYDGHELYDDPRVGPKIKEFGRRIGWLRGLDGSKERGLSGASGGVSFLHPKSTVRFTLAQGVEAIQIKQSKGKPRYLAIRPAIPIILVSNIDPKFTSATYKQPTLLSRADFVNPEDIDWFYGVKDFSNPEI